MLYTYLYHRTVIHLLVIVSNKILLLTSHSVDWLPIYSSAFVLKLQSLQHKNIRIFTLRFLSASLSRFSSVGIILIQFELLIYICISGSTVQIRAFALQCPALLFFLKHDLNNFSFPLLFRLSEEEPIERLFTDSF